MPITLFNETSPPATVSNQVCQMVATYLTDLSMLAVPASNLLFEVYEWALPCEVYVYLQWIGQPENPPVELLVAFDDEEPFEVVGFLMYLPMPTHPEACGITYMAVRKSHRGRGIGKAMIEQALSRYPHAELTCPVSKVGFYERLGFQVLRARNTQVVMNTREFSSEGMMGVVDAAQIYQSAEVRNIQNQQLQRWGRKEMVNAEKQLQRHISQLERQAAAFVKERLGL
ncbi:GNAT family N-acetyltransferase [Pseudomonas sp. P66]|uniref:GNAT family N-acetyltransferase n=1 Tax=Pseudomonas arcuscaelestis TaxID=2710591 RepID=A0ABS2BYE4_9PSED|nr:GNAT family N-acetyltransferase [Pseudomonas arcuscaelestis]MBM5458638.1 GNAT family N-acetyltransferase [Pseudomonas arcuscaelestis]